MCDEGGIDKKTNHSLKVTRTTHLYRSGIAEKTIQAQTRHKSIEALRVYEWAGEKDDQTAWYALSDISNSAAVVRYGKSADPPAIVTSPLTVGFGVMHSHFGATAPPSFNFSGCSVNIYTGPVTTTGRFDRSSTYNFGLSVEKF